MISAREGFRSELAYCYQIASSVPYSCFLNDLSLRTDDPLRYCTNTGSIPWKPFNADRLKHLNSLENEHKKSLYSPSISIISRKWKSSSLVLPKIVYQVSSRLYSKSEWKKTAEDKRTERGKISQQNLTELSKQLTWKPTRDVLASENGLEPVKVISLLMKNHLFWHRAVCSRACFCVQ